ncbi:Protein-disulfide reductase [Paraglaciecola sp. T6c]|uniref:Thiol:disulfide interchange protein DsbD n=1 Tax=Pseudoalteromonas atlantica (strain T6c / ATCC BAA-1087) TaxID=3042615 RepID=DSBD_PSEA6|nr:protein-disulfide reductase DsbD [Paraglaciecola sp. T6c]Q15ZS2.1 RecName: Full=Thiol:disulfide interchange protein DsbD; AltName: Full=Protein-disulfide reductase; Short=Disulfide reductase; Flags: Precursor [Paraglaciecola sp. T6c]ABG38616.1 Protein-disulfide reductase [Paraglaciecola sp. T6c]
MKLIASFSIFMLMSIWSFASLGQSNSFDSLFSNEPEFLKVDQAFVFDYVQNGDQLVVTWDIADDYYLYQQQFKAVSKNASLGEPIFPTGKMKEDEFFDEPQEVYYHKVSVTYPILQSQDDSAVKIRYQGCAEAGLCYPPTTQVVYLNAVNASDDLSNTDEASVESSGSVSQQFELADLLTGDQSLIWVLLIFLALGVGLAFTPCVFPMYPILSGIVIGQGKSISTSRAFVLSFVYVQGMALTYSLLGLVVASAGVQFQAALQHPIILGALIVVFALLALVMFGAWEFQLPSSWQEKLNGVSNQQKSGSYLGVLLMGAISGLVASPCTTAPLTGILLYIAQTSDLLLGFSALYALSLGMGIPLILFGITGGKLLPKAGAWMNIIKVTFGFMMLAVALMFVERLVSHMATDILWSLLGLVTFSYFYVMNQASSVTFGKGVRALVIFIGLFASAMYGYQTIFGQTSSVAGHTEQSHPRFEVVKNLDDFEQKLAAANAQGKTVMVDLYADWCVACKEFEKYTFPDTQVVDALSNTVWMQIDLTDNTATNIAFQEHFSILGLPTILFFDLQGKEISGSRVTGFMQASAFAAHAKNIL